MIIVILGLAVFAVVVYFFGYATTRAACGRGDENACIQWEIENGGSGGGYVRFPTVGDPPSGQANLHGTAAGLLDPQLSPTTRRISPNNTAVMAMTIQVRWSLTVRA